jgi:hypothetical protein
VILLVPTFVKILKLTFSKQIDLYYSILEVSFSGRSAMTPEFNFYGGKSPDCNCEKHFH